MFPSMIAHGVLGQILSNQTHVMLQVVHLWLLSLEYYNGSRWPCGKLSAGFDGCESLNVIWILEPRITDEKYRGLKNVPHFKKKKKKKGIAVFS